MKGHCTRMKDTACHRSAAGNLSWVYCSNSATTPPTSSVTRIGQDDPEWQARGTEALAPAGPDP
jgi:hypothetical protein